MRFLFIKNWLIIFLLIAISLVFSCASSKTAVTHFYILDPIDFTMLSAAQMDQTTTLSIGVTSLRLPQYLERPQIVTRRSENQLDLAEYHQWGGNLRKNMTRVLAKNLSQLLDTQEISIYPDIPQSPPDFYIELTVMKFERDPDGKVSLSAQWRLSADKDKKPLKTQFTSLDSPAVQNTSDMSETVKAMSELMGELSLIIGQEMLGFTTSRSDSGKIQKRP